MIFLLSLRLTLKNLKWIHQFYRFFAVYETNIYIISKLITNYNQHSHKIKLMELNLKNPITKNENPESPIHTQIIVKKGPSKTSFSPQSQNIYIYYYQNPTRLPEETSNHKENYMRSTGSEN
ncbi:hypothetical protein L1049_027632 [Liquidambar formosana]|uniref:Uncharacterized protein n=1 Tax=Liquidambar formosana TaxID=63359 RepID=A0AAP0RI61_LIQFO